MRKLGLLSLAALFVLVGCGGDEGPEPEVTTGVLTRITFTGGSQPQWSPDGGRILYCLDNRIYTITPTGADSLKIATITDGTAMHPHWNPADPTQICFINRNQSGDDDLWEIQTMTIGEEPVVVYSGIKQLSSVSFTRDGSEIAFTKDAGSTAGVFLIAAEGGAEYAWPREDGWGWVQDAECALDSDLISFVERKTGTAYNFFTLSREGGTAERLSNFGTEDDLTQAARSFDGNRYCIRWGKHFYWTEFNLYFINSTGGGFEQLTLMKTFDPNNPAWSPDGSMVVFNRQTISGEPSDLFVVDLSL
ncbi:TolB family protein [candidate division KSB1 bacterium]